MYKDILKIILDHSHGLGCPCKCDAETMQCENCEFLADDILEYLKEKLGEDVELYG